MIIIIYSVCPIFTNPPDWRKALSNGVKTHLFQLKTSKISPPAPPPPRAAGRGSAPTGAVLSCGEKNDTSERGGGKWLKCTIYTPGSQSNLTKDVWVSENFYYTIKYLVADPVIEDAIFSVTLEKLFFWHLKLPVNFRFVPKECFASPCLTFIIHHA